MIDAVKKLRDYANTYDPSCYWAPMQLNCVNAREIVDYIDALEKERGEMWKFIAGYLALGYESYGLNPDAMLADALQAFNRMENSEGVDNG